MPPTKTIIASRARVMSKPRGVQPAAELSPEARRRYLADAARRELDTLRASLDVRLAALEEALDHPDPRTSLEELVLNLARVATAEAEAAAARACLEAQLDAENRAALGGAEMRRSIEAERAGMDTVRADLEEAQAALEGEREGGAKLRKAIAEARTALEAERAAVISRDRALEQTRVAMLATQEAAEARVGTLD